MAAYAALTSLMHIIHEIEHHPLPPISIHKQQVASLTEIVTSLQEFLETYHSLVADGDEADPLEIRIADAAYAAEDVIESHIVDVIELRKSIIAQNQETNSSDPETDSDEEMDDSDDQETYSEEEIDDSDDQEIDSEEETNTSAHRRIQPLPWRPTIFSASATAHHQETDSGEESSTSTGLKPTPERNPKDNDKEIILNEAPHDSLCRGLEKVIIDMELIKKEVMEMVKFGMEAQMLLQRNVTASLGSSRSPNMVGFDDVLLEIMDKLTAGRLDCQVIPVVGMGGIGKTTLARHVYAHPYVKEHFDICAWTTISQKYDTREILCDLLCQVNKKSKEELSNMSEGELGLALYQYLSMRRFIIVMDDMWSIEAWEEIQYFFPDNSNSSRIMVTTRLSNM